MGELKQAPHRTVTRRWDDPKLEIGDTIEKALRRKMRVATVVGLVVVALCLYLGLYTTVLRY
jgi:hypothetical protein